MFQGQVRAGGLADALFAPGWFGVFTGKRAWAQGPWRRATHRMCAHPKPPTLKAFGFRATPQPPFKGGLSIPQPPFKRRLLRSLRCCSRRQLSFACATSIPQPPFKRGLSVGCVSLRRLFAAVAALGRTLRQMCGYPKPCLCGCEANSKVQVYLEASLLRLGFDLCLRCCAFI